MSLAAGDYLFGCFYIRPLTVAGREMDENNRRKMMTSCMLTYPAAFTNLLLDASLKSKHISDYCENSFCLTDGIDRNSAL